MAQNVLIINSSPRRAGHTSGLCAEFIKGLEESGKKHTLLEIARKRIAPCMGCGACRLNGGRCAIKDDMEEANRLFSEADGLVLASPMYYFTVNAQMKAFIDRLYAAGVNIGFRYPPKDIAFFMTAGEDLEDTFEVADMFYRRALDRIFRGWRDMGSIYAGGLENDADSISGHPALDRARRLGREF